MPNADDTVTAKAEEVVLEQDHARSYLSAGILLLLWPWLFGMVNATWGPGAGMLFGGLMFGLAVVVRGGLAVWKDRADPGRTAIGTNIQADAHSLTVRDSSGEPTEILAKDIVGAVPADGGLDVEVRYLRRVRIRGISTEEATSIQQVLGFHPLTHKTEHDVVLFRERQPWIGFGAIAILLSNCASGVWTGTFIGEGAGVATSHSIVSATQAWGYPMLAAFTLTCAILLARVVASRRLVVGADGFWHRRFARRQFVPFSAVTAVRADDEHIVIERRGGPSLRYRRDADSLALHARLHDVIEARAVCDSVAPPVVLARGDRSLKDWADALRSVLDKAAYREKTLDPPALAKIAADPKAAPDVRVAAAYACGTSTDDDAKERVRIAALGCADEDLARALEHAAEAELLDRETTRAKRRVVVD